MAYNSFINKQVGIQSPTFRFQKDRNNGAVLAGDGLGEFQFYGFDGSNYLLTSAITSTASGTIAANRIGSNLQFYTHPDSVTASTQRMVISNVGEVIINNPDTTIAALMVTNNGTGPNINLRTANNGVADSPHIHFTRSRAGTADVQAGDDLGRLEFRGFQGGTAIEAADIRSAAETVNGASVSGLIAFRTRPTSYAAIATRATISANGLVSINTPAAAGTALTVNGVNSNANYSLTTTASVSAALHNAAKFENTNITAGSGCQVSIDTQNQSGALGGDSSLRFLNAGIRAIALGIDSSTDQFVMANSSALGTANFFTYTASNSQINKPLQCAFHAYVSQIYNNVTGNNTNYQIIFNTETFDQNNNYNPATGLFTAPQTGRYLFTYSVYLLGLVNHAQYFTQLVTTSITYTLSDISPLAGILTNANQLGFPQASICVSMTAGDTAFVRINVNGGTNTQVVDVFGAVGDARTNFSGFLVC